MTNQCKCGSLDFFIEKQGNNTGLYCSMCGKWQKWMNKVEIRLFEHNHKPKKKSKINQTNADRIRSMSDEELADLASQHISCKGCNAGRRGICCGITCKKKLLKYLQSEAE